MKKEIKVFAPATVGNIACGFDVFGLAIEKPGDEVIVCLNNSGKVEIKKIEGDGGKLPINASENTAGVAVQALLRALNKQQGIEIMLKKKMPLGSGLGSSGASAAAAAYAANLLMGKPFSKMELVAFAMEGERIAADADVADNVAPSLLGGIVLVRSTTPLEVIQLPVPKKLNVVVVHPKMELLTKDMRAVLEKKIPIKTATQQWANTAAFVAALYKNDFDLLGHAAVDAVAEPFRAKLIPAFYEVKNAARKEGALACSISGSGPSIFALCDGGEKKIARAMQTEFRKVGLDCDVFISPINKKGARRID